MTIRFRRAVDAVDEYALRLLADLSQVLPASNLGAVRRRRRSPVVSLGVDAFLAAPEPGHGQQRGGWRSC